MPITPVTLFCSIPPGLAREQISLQKKFVNSSQGPKISIVTVTYNAAPCVRETLESIIGQSYPNIEYIVIDGASNDGTQSIINGYHEHISHFRSEPDKGTYDAMNKAIDIATGAWVIFINAGDFFVHDQIVAQVFAHPIPDNYDFIYGDYIWKGDKYGMRIESRPLDKMWQRICFSHQSLFSRTSLMKAKHFDLRYKIVSDYNFYFSCYMEGSEFLHLDFPISVFRAGGLSDINFMERTRERWKVVTRYKKSLLVHLYYLWLILDHYKHRPLSAWRALRKQ
ncbi:MAG TPA: glycosyltransferase [Desulfobulbaceae bacterium]|nr:glycosyltransferase [Desulfobulbaceae bacterium]